jgi:hypothetical protein
MSRHKGLSATGKIRSNEELMTSGIESAIFRLVTELPQPTTLMSSVFKEPLISYTKKIGMIKPRIMRRVGHAEHAEGKECIKYFCQKTRRPERTLWKRKRRYENNINLGLIELGVTVGLN